jgi:transcription termination factor NusB
MIYPHIINPFLNRNKVTDPGEFFGREHEIDYIVRNITYREPQSVAVIGERRFGKSSLLTRVHYIFSKRSCDLWKEYSKEIQDPDKFVCIMIDPEEISTSSSKEFTWILIDELLVEKKELAEFIEYYPKGLTDNNFHKRHPQIILKNLLRNACDAGYRFVFFFDEFELLARNLSHEDVNYLNYLRGTSDNYKLAYVTSSRKPLSEIAFQTNPEGSPFDNNFSNAMYLGLLADNECEDLIDGILKANGYSEKFFSSTEKMRAIELAGKHPYFLKMACAHLFDWAINTRPVEQSWENAFCLSAGEEFDRMWGTLDKKEKDWILIAHQPDGVAINRKNVYDELNLLYKRGLLDKGDGDGKLTLFSQSFSRYIREYLNKLEDRYEKIERNIRKSYSKLDLSHVEQIIQELADLINQWHERKHEEQPGLLGHSYLKCTWLLKILSSLQNIQILCKEKTDEGEINNNGKSFERKVDKAVREFCVCFENNDNDWFGQDESKLNPMTGKNILDAAIQSLIKVQKNMIFGNGYDRMLSIRVEFMKKYDPANFSDFEELTKASFERLVEVYDYSRASSVLNTKLSGFCRKMSEFFLKKPVFTIAITILLPLLTVSIATFFLKEPDAASFMAQHKILSKFIYSSLTLIPLLFFVYLTIIILRPAFSEKYCELPNSRHLYEKLIFQETYFISIMTFITLSGFLYSDKDIRSLATEKIHIYLGITFIIGLISCLFIVIFIKNKVLDFTTAFKRARYFCSFEYFKAFALLFILYFILGSTVCLFGTKKGQPGYKILEIAEQVPETAQPSEPEYVTTEQEVQRTETSQTEGKKQIEIILSKLNVIYFKDFPLNLGLILGTAFIGPVAGLYRFIRRFFIYQE